MPAIMFIPESGHDNSTALSVHKCLHDGAANHVTCQLLEVQSCNLPSHSLTVCCDSHSQQRLKCIVWRAGVQADFTLRRLQQLKERIMGTESLVAIELDSRRNELVALNLVCIDAFVGSQIVLGLHILCDLLL